MKAIKLENLILKPQDEGTEKLCFSVRRVLHHFSSFVFSWHLLPVKKIHLHVLLTEMIRHKNVLRWTRRFEGDIFNLTFVILAYAQHFSTMLCFTFNAMNGLERRLFLPKNVTRTFSLSFGKWALKHRTETRSIKKLVAMKP